MVQGTIVVAMANVVTLITALSLSAITTNGLVLGGGAYFVISRNLGPQFGGAIGLLFYIAQAVATSLYVVGFAESIVDLMKSSGAQPFTGDFGWDQRVIGLGTCILLLGVALVGVGWVAKSQVILLIILIATLLSVVIGAFLPDLPSVEDNTAKGFAGFGSSTFSDNLGSGYIVDPVTLSPVSLFSVFAVFFPAVTGIMAGANLSGDLADPSKAIPKGTIMGIGITFVSYVLVLWFIGSTVVRCADPSGTGYCAAADFGTIDWARRLAADPEGAATLGGLLFNRLVITSVSLWSPLVYAGIFAATLSSALASMVGAPRILQALAKDRLFDFKWFYYFSQLPYPEAAGKDELGRQKTGRGGPVEGGESTAAAAAAAGPAADAELPSDAAESPEPIRGYVLTFFIACGCVLIGELNFIAPIISQFFLLSYALVNYACVAASISKAPGWRPNFPYYHPALAGFGALLCIALMFAFDWITALVAVFIAFAAHRYIDIAEPDVNWGTASDALRYLRAVRALHALSRVRTDLITDLHHAKVFRPAYLAIIPGSDPQPRAGPAIGLLSALWRGRGLSLVTQVLIHDSGVAARRMQAVAPAGRRSSLLLATTDAAAGAEDEPEDDQDAAARDVRAEMHPPSKFPGYINAARAHRRRLGRLLDQVCGASARRAFFVANALHAPTFRDGAEALVESAGVSALRCNTVVLEWPYGNTSRNAYALGPSPTELHESIESITAPSLGEATPVVFESFEGAVCDALDGRQGVIVVRDDMGTLVPANTTQSAEMDVSVTGDTIDLWWLHWDGGLALLVPWLMQRSTAFEGKTLRVFTSGSPDGVDNDATLAADARTAGLARLVGMLRFEAQPRSVKLNATDASAEGVARFSATFPGILTHDQLTSTIRRFHRAESLPLMVALEKGKQQAMTVEPAAASAGGAPSATGAVEEGAVAVEVLGDQGDDVVEAHASPLLEAIAEDEPTEDESETRTALRRAVEELGVDKRRRLAELTLWNIRAGDLIRQHSKDAAAVFVVFPKPQRWFPLGIESAWMEALSHSLPPTILIRGNGATVVTHAS
jgi:amino acid transporter